MKTSVGVLISGNGSNLQALIDASHAADCPYTISVVFSNKAEAYGLTRAAQAGIPTLTLSHKDYDSREAFDRAMHAALSQHDVDILCLAGFMRLVTPWFVSQWRGRMLNIHPSLLPAFKGAHAIQDAFEAGAKVTGCSVHLVTEEMDAGEVLGRSEVPILPSDTLEALTQRIHAAEHQLYPEVLKKYVNHTKTSF